MSLHKEVQVPLKFNVDNILLFKENFASVLHDAACKVIVLVGHGNYFSQGLDLDYVITNNTENFLSKCVSTFNLVKTSAKPVIAKVKGDVIAGGCIWLGIADFVISTKEPMFCLPEATFGLFPSLVTASLLERLKPQDIKHMILISQSINAETAHKIGLVDEVVADDKIDEKISSYVNKLGRISTVVVQELKEFIEMKHEFNKFILHGAAKLQNNLNDSEIVENIKDRLKVINMLKDD